MIMNKIVIGTANFGMDYGLGNKQRKLLDSDIFVIINATKKNRDKYHRYCYFLWE